MKSRHKDSNGWVEVDLEEVESLSVTSSAFSNINLSYIESLLPVLTDTERKFLANTYPRIFEMINADPPFGLGAAIEQYCNETRKEPPSLDSIAKLTRLIPRNGLLQLHEYLSSRKLKNFGDIPLIMQHLVFNDFDTYADALGSYGADDITKYNKARSDIYSNLLQYLDDNTVTLYSNGQDATSNDLNEVLNNIKDASENSKKSAILCIFKLAGAGAITKDVLERMIEISKEAVVIGVLSKTLRKKETIPVHADAVKSEEQLYESLEEIVNAFTGAPDRERNYRASVTQIIFEVFLYNLPKSPTERIRFSEVCQKVSEHLGDKKQGFKQVFIKSLLAQLPAALGLDKMPLSIVSQEIEDGLKAFKEEDFLGKSFRLFTALPAIPIFTFAQVMRFSESIFDQEPPKLSLILQLVERLDAESLLSAEPESVSSFIARLEDCASIEYTYNQLKTSPREHISTIKQKLLQLEFDYRYRQKRDKFIASGRAPVLINTATGRNIFRLPGHISKDAAPSTNRRYDKDELARKIFIELAGEALAECYGENITETESTALQLLENLYPDNNTKCEDLARQISSEASEVWRVQKAKNDFDNCIEIICNCLKETMAPVIQQLSQKDVNNEEIISKFDDFLNPDTDPNFHTKMLAALGEIESTVSVDEKDTTVLTFNLNDKQFRLEEGKPKNDVFIHAFEQIFEEFLKSNFESMDEETLENSKKLAAQSVRESSTFCENSATIDDYINRKALHNAKRFASNGSTGATKA